MPHFSNANNADLIAQTQAEAAKEHQARMVAAVALENMERAKEQQRLAEVRGTIAEIYGNAARAHVVIELTPEVSGDVVDEPTTVSLPLESVRRAGVAA